MTFWFSSAGPSRRMTSRSLKSTGVHGVFPSHAKLEEISAFIKENVQATGQTFLNAVFGKKQEGHSSGGSSP